MEFVGMDLGKRQSDVCFVDERGNVLERIKIRTCRESMTKHFTKRGALRIAFESCRDAGWVYDHLCRLGFDVVVVDTSRARTIGIGLGRRKTDRRDAEFLARALVSGMAPRAHVMSQDTRKLRDIMIARDQLVRIRTRLVTTMRGQLQGRGVVFPGCDPRNFTRNLRKSGVEEAWASCMQSMMAVCDSVCEQIDVLQSQLEELAKAHEAHERLVSVPGVGLIVSLAFIAALDDPTRFENAHQVQAYLGLVPSEHSTGGKRRTGGITKCGNKLARHILIQGAMVMMMAKGAQEDPLVVWAKQVMQRRGRQKAAVALARKLAGVLWEMWVDGT